MPIVEVQRNSGGFTGTTGNATLGVGTTAGNTLVLAVGSTSTVNTPAGFTKDTAAGSATAYIFRKSNVAAAETSWTITAGAARDIAWDIFELQGVDPDFPVDASAVSAGTSGSSGTTTASTTYDGLAVVVHAALVSTGGTINTFSGHTNSFEEQDDHGQSNGTTAIGMSVSWRPVVSIGTWTCTATATGGTVTGVIVVYTAQGVPHAADVVVHAGFEWGTAAGIATTALLSPFDAAVGTPAIVSTNARTGTYCLELSGTAAAENLTWITTTGSLYAGAQFGVLRLAVLFPSSLPAGDVDVCSLDATVSAVIRYRSSGTKLTLQVGAGTEVNGPAVAADTWYGIDLRLDTHTTTYAADWQVDGVDQPQATVTSTVTNITTVRLGWAGASTAAIRYDDVAYSKIAGVYPMGDIRVVGLGVDPAGTVTLSGTTANFQTFTGNGGTMTAWNATTARNNIDELPPTISASADGLAQITTAATDYVQIPMSTYAAAVNNAGIRAVRMYACGWAASTTAATIGFRVWNGTTETNLYTAADPGFDNSTTVPAWVCKSRTTTGVKITYTQAQLDALEYRVGFSSDASPAIGIHAIYAEVAVQSGQSLRVAEVTGLEGVTAAATVDAVLDPVTGGVIAYTASAAPDFAASVSYTIRGTPTTTNIPAGTNDLVIVDATDATEVTSVSIGPA